MVVLNIFHVLIALAMVALILVQRGAGATAGAAFGSGASGTVFGARGAGTFLSKSTWVLAGLFCAISLTMAVMVSRVDTSVKDNLGVVSTTPATPQKAAQAPATQEQNAAATQEQNNQASGQKGDLPAFQNTKDEAGSKAEAVQKKQAADDLPAIDGGEVESTANKKGGKATGTGSDGS